jgi:hypothetical protein
MKFEVAQELAKTGQLKSCHKQEISKTIKWLNHVKAKETNKYDKQIEKWIKLIKDNEVEL